MGISIRCWSQELLTTTIFTCIWIRMKIMIHSIASLVVQIPACYVGDLGLIPGLGRSPGGGHGNLLQYSCLENPHAQRSLAGYGPWGCKESDTTERLVTARDIHRVRVKPIHSLQAVINFPFISLPQYLSSQEMFIKCTGSSTVPGTQKGIQYF